MTTAAPTFLDLFCGLGGLGIGLERAGMVPLGGIDHWKDALATFKHNHPHVPALQADITKLRPSEVEALAGRSIDVIAGGPPCQGFSTVGKRDHADPRNLLWRSFSDIVDHFRPAYVIIENVEGLNVMKGGAVRDGIIREFGEMGYGMRSMLLRAADYGVPQLRKRMVFLGWRDGTCEPEFPMRMRSAHVTVADAISDLPPLRSGESRSEYASPPSTPYQAARRAGSTTVHNHEAARHPASLVEILNHIPDGGNRKSIPDELQPKSGFHNSYARLASWKPAIAVTSNMRKPSSARATHPSQPRGLTVREGLRLQSFDDSFIVTGSRTSQYLQVGNAVPPLLAEAIGHQVVAAFAASARTGDARGGQPSPGRSKVQALLFDQPEESPLAAVK